MGEKGVSLAAGDKPPPYVKIRLVTMFHPSVAHQPGMDRWSENARSPLSWSKGEPSLQFGGSWFDKLTTSGSSSTVVPRQAWLRRDRRAEGAGCGTFPFETPQIPSVLPTFRAPTW